MFQAIPMIVVGPKEKSLVGDDGPQMLNRPDNTTYGIDLSKDWANSTLNLVQTTRPPDAVALLSESLWFDEKQNSIYCFGGRNSYANGALNSLAPPVESIWGFKQNDNGSAAWYQVIGPVSTTPFPTNIHRLTHGISASDGSRAYYLGGLYSGDTSPSTSNVNPKDLINPPGLLIFDFNTYTITNSSDGGYLSPQISGSGDSPPGTMINIPTYGDNGILVILPSGRDRQDSAFNNITLYDKQNQKWYSQITSGDIPQPRFSFCAAGVEGDGKNSFEIFMHGGVINNVVGSQAANSDQVYILSLPSFRWFRANYTSAHSRGGHTCHIKNSQMIMIGGQDPTHSVNWLGDADGPKDLFADPWLQGIGVFDMKALRFQDSYQAKARAYETPDFIKTYYSTAGNQYPSSWTSAAVKELFERKTNSSSNTTNPITSSPSSTSTPSSRQKLSHGMVAGIVVGCTAITVLCAVGAAFTLKRRSKSIKSTEVPSHSPHMLPSEPQFTELSAEHRAQELLNEHHHRTELPDTSTKSAAELSSGAPIGQELSG
ncbi:hypothetical protein MMC22_008661 [Lobaria immixta]|nr:hypothetical protein [Lobaria immixta]